MRLESLKARLNRLLEVQGPPDERPSTIVLLPANGRGPASDVRPYPRVNRVGRAAIIVYKIEDGQPSPEAIRQLVDGVVQP